MTELLKQKFTNKKIFILGFGMEGRSTYRFLRKLLPDALFTIGDKNIIDINEPVFFGDEHLQFHCGNDYLQDISTFDLVIKTPGISLMSIEGADMSKFSSHTEIFMELFGSQIVGITGTKGKSTTTGLIHHIASLHTSNTVLVGNIGIPPLDLVDSINSDTIIVYELSSHQLEQVSCSPHISVLLNLYQEHLDHYKSYEAYQLAKFNIARFQKTDDVFIYNDDDETLKSLINANPAEGRKRSFSFGSSRSACFVDNDFVVCCVGGKTRRVVDLSRPRLLIGDHNIMNIMAAVCACAELGIADETIEKGVQTFRPLQHRMEFVTEIDGVKYFDDSIATIPEAAIAAARALQPVGTMILGGFDRGVDYTALCRFLLSSEISNYIFMDEAGVRMRALYIELGGDESKTFQVDSMKEAVQLARKKTAPGQACLLSPAAASYGRYLNFKERGNEFRKFLTEQDSV